MKNKSISLGNHFDQFVSSQVEVGRFQNVSEIILAVTNQQKTIPKNIMRMESF
jgi:Bacterial antitoxin of ParD toxin-antitoxin type II system and RHH